LFFLKKISKRLKKIFQFKKINVFKTPHINPIYFLFFLGPPPPPFFKINFNHICLEIFTVLQLRETRVQRSIVPLATQAYVEIKHF